VRRERLNRAATEEDWQPHIDRALSGEYLAGRRLIGFLEHESGPAKGIQIGAEGPVVITDPADTLRIRGAPEALSQIVTDQPGNLAVSAGDRLRLRSKKARMADHEDERAAVPENPRHCRQDSGQVRDIHEAQLARDQVERSVLKRRQRLGVVGNVRMPSGREAS
jgi:hypothetical protein